MPLRMSRPRLSCCVGSPAVSAVRPEPAMRAIIRKEKS